MSQFWSPHDIGTVQTLRKVGLLVATGLLVVSTVFVSSTWAAGHPLHESIEAIGIALIAASILGRSWCTLYIGGRKSTDLVAEGPYSVVRNPLYFFSIVGSVGIGAQFGSIVLAAFTGTVVMAIFLIVAKQEEKHLRARLGHAYEEYLHRVPRFLPRLSLWHNVETLVVRPTNVMRTFADACVFLLGIPVAEMLEWVQVSHPHLILLKVL